MKKYTIIAIVLFISGCTKNIEQKQYNENLFELPYKRWERDLRTKPPSDTLIIKNMPIAYMPTGTQTSSNENQRAK